MIIARPTVTSLFLHHRERMPAVLWNRRFYRNAGTFTFDFERQLFCVLSMLFAMFFSYLSRCTDSLDFDNWNFDDIWRTLTSDVQRQFLYPWNVEFSFRFCAVIEIKTQDLWNSEFWNYFASFFCEHFLRNECFLFIRRVFDDHFLDSLRNSQ